MVKTKSFLVILLFIASVTSWSQVKDIGGTDYTFLLGEGDDPNFSRFRVWFNFPTKLNDRGHFLVNGIRYINAKINFESATSFSTVDLEEFHILEYTIGYTYPMNKKWRFTAQFSPTLSSNLTNNISFDDLVLSGGIIFIRTLEAENGSKKSRLTLGLTYSQTIGIPAPIPFVTYFREINDRWSYTVGFPISKAKYFFNTKKTSLEAFARLDGYFVNLSNDIPVNGQNAESISLSQVITGIGFDKYYGKRGNLFFKIGYTLRNSLELNENIKDEVFNFNLSNAFYFRGGFKFNF